MTLPPAVDALWIELERVRAALLNEVDGLSQAQLDWRSREGEWSVGELIHHLTLAEIATGKLTSKLLREAGDAVKPFPSELTRFASLPSRAAGPAEAPPLVRPEHGHPAEGLLSAFRAACERSRQSVERLAQVDPRPLKWPHPAFGDLDLGQWWLLQAHHDADHLQQLRAVKATPGFPSV